MHAPPPRFNGSEARTRAGQLVGVVRVRPRDEAPSSADRLLKQFGRPERLLSCECERSDSTSLAQALSLLSGASLQQRLAEPKNRLTDLLAAHAEDAPLVEELYWTALSRSPTAEEAAAAGAWLGEAQNRRAALEDIAWALLNSPEFLFRH